MVNDPRNNKYAGNRHLWRRVYPTQRRKPVVETFIETATEVTFSYDLNKTLRHRDFFLIKNIPNGVFIPEIFGEYDEGLIFFNNTTFATASFSQCFSNTPDAVVLTVEPASDFSDNIIAYGLSYTACSMSIGLSAPFSGAIRYRAAYSQFGYPVAASSSFEPLSGTFTMFAGSVTASNSDSFVVTYSLGALPPVAVRMTTWDFFTNFDVDVFIDKTVGLTGSNVSLSAPINNILSYIAIR